MTTKHHIPRVWVGEREMYDSWRWWGPIDGWHMSNRLETGVFTPGTQPKPTEDPREMESIATCSVVDWEDE